MKTKILLLFLLLAGLFPFLTCKKVEKEMLVSTGTVTDISLYSAEVTGRIVDLGEGVSAYGHCYGTSPNVSVSGSKTDISTSLTPTVGGFTSTLESLLPSTKYYVKAYCSRGSETVYGDEISFTTLSDEKPSITTDEITLFDKETAVLGGEVISQGGTPVTERGVCYNLAPGPTIDNYKVQFGTGVGKFSVTVENLTSDKKYYVRAYAINMGGISYGNERNFTTLPDVPVPPTVTTDEVTQITSGSAVCGGNVTAEGSSPVATKGVCWGTNTTPTIELNNKSNDGTGVGHFTSNITGLDPGTKYYVRAYATNSAGTSYGTEYNFTSSAVIPTLNTLPVTSITSTSASSGGNITSTGGASIISKGVCWKTSSGPNIFDNKTENGIGPDDFISVLTNLQPGTKYYVRAYATNSVGPGYGNEVEFTTYISPSVTTDDATSVGKTSVMLNGTVNPNGQSTNVTFEYGTTTSYGMTINAAQSPLLGTVNSPVNANVTGLTEGTTYHYRVKAVSSGGTSYGEDKIFTTLCNSAVASTEPATSISSSFAILNGFVNANGFSTIVTFEYGTSISYGSTKTATQSPVSGNTQTAVNVSISGLTPNTTYFYRIKAESCGGIVYSMGSFFSTTCTTPVATTADATNVHTNSVTLNGLVNASNFITTVMFEYGTTTGYGNTKAASQSPVSGNNGTSVSTDITGLIPNTTYHFRIKAENCGGIVYSDDKPFTTPCSVPTAITLTASGVSTTVATLNGSINANSFSTEATFEYGLSTSYGNTVTAVQSPVTGTGNTPISVTLSGLAQNSVYHYRVKAVNCGGSVNGDDQQFITLCTAPTPTTNSATSITDISARLNGVINANGFSTTVTFEYGTSTSYGSTINAIPNTITSSSNTSAYANVTNLLKNTTYHFRIKAVNCGGTTYGDDQVFTTNQCPNSITVNHIAGTVSPVTKTVTYGVVLSNLSGQNKCWITRNLGADNQPTLVTDDTESASGWYWQFNRKQGYKHDGIVRTPSFVWISYINEASSWLQVNDPCTILLGTGWRIPTFSEWSSMSVTFGWNSFYPAFSSELKLHAGGSLNPNTSGGLYNRGTFLYYFTSTDKDGQTYSWAMYGSPSYFTGGSTDKAGAMPLRCIKD